MNSEHSWEPAAYDFDLVIAELRKAVEKFDRVAVVLYRARGNAIVVFDDEPDRDLKLRVSLKANPGVTPDGLPAALPTGFVAGSERDDACLFATIPLPDYAEDASAKEFLEHMLRALCALGPERFFTHQVSANEVRIVPTESGWKECRQKARWPSPRTRGVH